MGPLAQSLSQQGTAHRVKYISEKIPEKKKIYILRKKKQKTKHKKWFLYVEKKMSLPVFRQSSSCAHPPPEEILLFPGSRTPGGIEPVTQPVHTVNEPT